MTTAICERAVPAAPWPVAPAALIAVVHRRTRQDLVRVTAHTPSGARRFDVDLGDDPRFDDLVARLPGHLDDAVRLQVGGEPGEVVELTRSGGVSAIGAALGRPEVDRLADQLATALADATRSPHTRLSVLRLASEEALALVRRWGGTGIPPGEPRLLHELVAEQAARNPAAPAVTCVGKTLSYREIDRRAGRLAARLVAADPDPRPIAVLARRSTELVVALLGVLKTGAPYLAIEPDAPPPRLARQLRDAGVRLAVAEPSLRDRLPPDVTVIAVSGPANPLPQPDPPRDPARLAYLSYTSGSTGEPKAVCVPHAAVSRLVVRPDWAEFGPDDVFLHVAPAAFDASTLEIWGALGNGARLAVFPPGPVTPERLAAALRAERVTVLWLTAGLFHRMVADHVEAFAGLRHVLAGGDVIAKPPVEKLLSAHPGLVFTNGYGPTEDTTFTTCWTSRVAPAGDTVPIGRPISGTRVVLLDRALRPVPVGVPGELHACGAGLAHGYLNRGGQTAAAFLPDPFATNPGERMYRTGDLARWLPDGTLEFLGRTDRQLKINGYRVEPGEVEAALAGHPDVREAVVTGQPDGSGGIRLLAYVVPRSGSDGTGLAVRLRDWLRGELPDHLVPWAIQPVAALRLNANGKVDRSALPTARCAPRALPTEYRPPRTPVERRLAELWSELLGVEPVGIEDDFFELGGHSLVAAELLARIHAEFGVELGARTLYLRPVIAELAEHLDGVRPAPASG